MADQSSSRLLCLPRELRDMVYDMVFERNVLDLDEDNEKPWKYQEPDLTGLLMTCKQDRAEAIDIYYSTLHVCVLRADVLENWVQSVPHERVQKISKIFHGTIVQYKELPEMLLGDHGEILHAALLRKLKDLGVILQPEKLEVTCHDNGVRFTVPEHVTYRFVSDMNNVQVPEWEASRGFVDEAQLMEGLSSDGISGPFEDAKVLWHWQITDDDVVIREEWLEGCEET